MENLLEELTYDKDNHVDHLLCSSCYCTAEKVTEINYVLPSLQPYLGEQP